jgi:hypothetical protein
LKEVYIIATDFSFFFNASTGQAFDIDIEIEIEIGIEIEIRNGMVSGMKNQAFTGFGIRTSGHLSVWLAAPEGGLR